MENSFNVDIQEEAERELEVAVRNCLNFQRGVIARHTRLAAARDDFERKRRERASVPTADKGEAEGKTVFGYSLPIDDVRAGGRGKKGSVLGSNSTD